MSKKELLSNEGCSDQPFVYIEVHATFQRKASNYRVSSPHIIAMIQSVISKLN